MSEVGHTGFFYRSFFFFLDLGWGLISFGTEEVLLFWFELSASSYRIGNFFSSEYIGMGFTSENLSMALK